MTDYADLGELGEDQRIDRIGKAVMQLAPDKVGAFVTDAEPGKAERYLRKLKERFPKVRILQIFRGPVSGSVTVQVAPPEEKE